MRIRQSEYAALAAELRRARHAAALTQAGLADKLGVPQSFVSKYESGERKLDLLEVRRICMALNLSLGTLLLRLDETLSGSK